MTLRFKLRTLLILLAILPPLGAVVAPPLLERFKAKPVPLPAPPAKPAPAFAIYTTGSADPNSIYQVLTKMYAGAPDVRMSYDATTGSIAVLAPPSVHAVIEPFMAGLPTDPPASSPAPPESPWFPEPPPARVSNRL
jgi:hypothetical protein